MKKCYRHACAIGLLVVCLTFTIQAQTWYYDAWGGFNSDTVSENPFPVPIVTVDPVDPVGGVTPYTRLEWGVSVGESDLGPSRARINWTELGLGAGGSLPIIEGNEVQSTVTVGGADALLATLTHFNRTIEELDPSNPDSWPDWGTVAFVYQLNIFADEARTELVHSVQVQEETASFWESLNVTPPPAEIEFGGSGPHATVSTTDDLFFIPLVEQSESFVYGSEVYDLNFSGWFAGETMDPVLEQGSYFWTEEGTANTFQARFQIRGGQAPVIPEPSTWGLILIGLVAVFRLRKR